MPFRRTLFSAALGTLILLNGIPQALASATPPILAYPAGRAQTQVLIVPWSGKSSVTPQLQVKQVPTGVSARLQGWAPHHHAVRIAVTIPSQLAPGLYPGQFVLKQGTKQDPVSVDLAVEALYIGLNGNGNRKGVVVESTDGQILTGISQRITADIQDQGGEGVDSIAYVPTRGDLIVAAGEDHPQDVQVFSTAGRLLSPLPQDLLSLGAGHAPSFMSWEGGNWFLWSSTGMRLVNIRSGAIVPISEQLAQDGAPFPDGWRVLYPRVAADPANGEVFLCNGASQHHPRAWIYVFNRQGRYVGHIAALYDVLAITYDPVNQEVYALGYQKGTNGRTLIQAFSTGGQPIPLPPGAFPGTGLLSTPIEKNVLSANPINGDIFYLSKNYILEYSQNGRVLHKLPVPSRHVTSITFVPGALTTPSIASTSSTTYAPTAYVPQSTRTMAPAPVRPACPPGYRCVPDGASPTEQPSPPHPTLNHTLNQVTNTANNIDDLSNAVSGVMNALR